MADRKNYIDKEQMYAEVVKSQANGRVTEELGRMFMALAEKYSHHRMFRDYERKYGKAFKEDLLSTGLHACVKAANKFDVEKSNNPFSYFTTCLFRAYLGYLTKEYGFMNVKNAAKVDQGLRGDYGYEEMIKEQEEAQKVEDEEEFVEEEETDEEGDETDDVVDEFGMTEEDEIKEPTKRVVYNHLDSMTLWGDDEEVPTEKPSFESTINSTFGVSK